MSCLIPGSNTQKLALAGKIEEGRSQTIRLFVTIKITVDCNYKK
jgi:hypothetical protein